MPSLNIATRSHLNPRWHLVNLVPLWLLQALTSSAIAYVPFYCILSCGPFDKPTHIIAPLLCLLALTILVAEGGLFFTYHRRLTPLRALAFQSAKLLCLAAQWLVLVIHGKGDAVEATVWAMMGLAGLGAFLSLPFSLHLIYAIVDYVRFRVRGVEVDGVDGASRDELAPLNEGEGDESDLDDDGNGDGNVVGNVEIDSNGPKYEVLDRWGSVAVELSWPRRGKLLPNWILQLVSLPLLWFLRYMGINSWTNSGWLSEVSLYVAIAVLACLICFEAYTSFRPDGKRLSLQSYLKLQIVKVGALYFLLDLVVLACGGWKLQIGNWSRSLLGVVALSILFGSSFITEYVWAAAEWRSSQ